MVRRLQPWHENISKRQVKTPKIYFRDSGILHSLLGIPDMAARALAQFQSLREADQDADDPEVTGFALVRQDAPKGSLLWIHDDDHGDVEAVIRFVLRLADELDLIGLWGFQYALTCSRPRLDAFGGGAHVIDLGARKSIGWTSSQEWLAAALNGEHVDA